MCEPFFCAHTMWNAIRNDLQEFVSTVKEDTQHVIRGGQKIRMDSSLSYSVELFTEPLTEEETKELLSSIEEEDSFDVTQYEALLETDSQLRQIYEELVNPDDENTASVSPEDFWKRYAVRCSSEEEEEATRSYAETPPPTGNAGTTTGTANSSFASFLGGAVQKVTQTLTETDGGQEYDGEEKPVGLFGRATRPPFVMNTAIPSDDEEEEEEEFGWGEDDEEEDDDEEEAEEEGEIEFTDPIVQQLKEQLQQTMEERDQLHQTIELQRNEIVALQQNKTENSHEVENDEATKLKQELFEKDSEIAALKANLLDLSKVQDEEERQEARDMLEMQTLLQKSNVELKNLIEESQKDKHALQNSKKEIQKLQRMLEEREESISSPAIDTPNTPTFDDETVRQLEQRNDELKREKEELENSLEEMKSLQDKIDTLQHQLEKEKEKSISVVQESQAFQLQAKEQKDVFESQIAELRKQLNDAAAQNKRLQEENQALQMQIETSSALQTKVDDLNAKLLAEKDKVDELQSKDRDSCSTESGVKVEEPPVVTKLNANVDEEEEGVDEWDDDW